MVVPMRREFGCALDVHQMYRDANYAETIVAQALTSQVQSLREHARLVGRHLSAAEASPGSSQRGAEPTAPATDMRHNAARAARLLIDLIGPMGESLAIRIERAPDTPALAQLIGDARVRIADMRGDAAASDYVHQVSAGDAAAGRISAAAPRRTALTA